MNLSPSPHKWIWNVLTTRICLFIWLCSHNSVPLWSVGFERFYYSWYSVFCVTVTMNHWFIFSVSVPLQIHSGRSLMSHMSCGSPSLQPSWIGCILIPSLTVFPANEGLPWNILFPIDLWHLWLHRNSFVFWNGVVDLNTQKLCIYKICWVLCFNTGVTRLING